MFVFLLLKTIFCLLLNPWKTSSWCIFYQIDSIMSAHRHKYVTTAVLTLFCYQVEPQTVTIMNHIAVGCLSSNPEEWGLQTSESKFKRYLHCCSKRKKKILKILLTLSSNILQAHSSANALIWAMGTVLCELEGSGWSPSLPLWWMGVCIVHWVCFCHCTP